MSEEDLLTEVDREWVVLCAPPHGLDCISYTLNFDGDDEPHGASNWPSGIYKTSPGVPRPWPVNYANQRSTVDSYAMASRVKPFYIFAILVLAAGGIPKGRSHNQPIFIPTDTTQATMREASALASHCHLSKRTTIS